MANAVIVAGLLSTIVTVIKEVEERSKTEVVIDGQEKLFSSEFKRELALTAIREVYQLRNPAVPFETIVGAITAAINTVVSIFNAIKLFRK